MQKRRLCSGFEENKAWLTATNGDGGEEEDDDMGIIGKKSCFPAD